MDTLATPPQTMLDARIKGYPPHWPALALAHAGAQGWQLLRGDLQSARRFLLKAYELEPDNPYIQNNLKLLGETEKTVKRTGSL